MIKKNEAWVKTDVGLRRNSNQDSFLVNSDLGLYVVADGMGGHFGGEVASKMAVEAIEEYIHKNKSECSSSQDLLTKAFEEANEKIYNRGTYESPELSGMGTTMVCIYCEKTRLFICNVGDSRCYLFRKPHLWQVTEDHSLLNEQLRSGILREDQIESFEKRNVITRSVGYERHLTVDIFERIIHPGDCFLLCSDGLSGLLDDDEISKILNNETSGDEIVARCIETALKKGGDDNITVIYLQTT